jgi:hypothetical protein
MHGQMMMAARGPNEDGKVAMLWWAGQRPAAGGVFMVIDVASF